MEVWRWLASPGEVTLVKMLLVECIENTLMLVNTFQHGVCIVHAGGSNAASHTCSTGYCVCVC